MNDSPLVKICGIRFVESAVYAVSEGADFIGLVFHPKSKRYVDMKTAKQISEAVSFHGAIPVAVVVEHDASEIMKICKKTGITYVQFHGKEAIASIPEITDNIIKILSVKVSAEGVINTVQSDVLRCLDFQKDYLLYDGENPGSGARFSLEMFQPISDFRFFMAGGLNPDNVNDVIAQVIPFGVDVSSGVEVEPGVKDPRKIKQFIQQVKYMQRER